MLNFDLFKSLKQTYCYNEVFMQVQVRTLKITDISLYRSIHNPSDVDVSYGLLGMEKQTRCNVTSMFCTETTTQSPDALPDTSCESSQSFHLGTVMCPLRLVNS